MPKINIREVLVLIFVSIFVAISLPIIRVLITSDFFGSSVIFLLPLIFGFCSAYIMYKGDKANFYRKSIIQGVIISIFVFIFTFYFSGTFFRYTEDLLDYIKSDRKLAEACIGSLSPRCKLLETLLLSARIEKSEINISMLALLGYLSGILLYSLVIQRFAER